MGRRVRESESESTTTNHTNLDLRHQLDSALAAHPWMDAWSGDIPTRQAFDRKGESLMKLLGTVPPEEQHIARELWAKYAPSNFKLPPFLAGETAPPVQPARNGRRLPPQPDPLAGLADEEPSRRPAAPGAALAHMLSAPPTPLAMQEAIPADDLVCDAPPASPPYYGEPLQLAPQSPAAAERIARIVTSIVSQDPHRLYEELEAVEKLPGRTLSLIIEQLDLVLGYASKASRLAMIANHVSRKFKEIEAPAREAVLRDKARMECPARQNKDGSEKALTVQEIADWIAINCAEEQAAIKLQLIDLETFSHHAANLERIWGYRSRDLQEMIGGVRATGDGVSNPRGESYERS